MDDLERVLAVLEAADDVGLTALLADVADEGGVAPDGPEVAMRLHWFAQQFAIRGNAAKAEQLGRRAVAIRERILGPRDPDFGASLFAVAMAIHQQGRPAEAEPFARRALDAVGTGDDVGECVVCGVLADIEAELDRPEDAERFARRALAACKRQGDGAPSELVEALRRCARLARRRGDHAESVSTLVEALAVLDRPDADPRALGGCFAELGESYVALGQDERAEAALVRAIQLLDVPGVEDSLVFPLGTLAGLYAGQLRAPEAEALLRRTITLGEKLGPGTVEMALVLALLADVLRLQNNYDGALAHLERARRIVDALTGPGSEIAAATCLRVRAMVEISRRQFREAESLARRAVAVFEQLGPRHQLAVALCALASGLAGQGKYRAALEYAERGVGVLEELVGPAHVTVAMLAMMLPAIYLGLGQTERAERVGARSLAAQEAAFGADDPRLSESLTAMTLVYRERGLYAQAERLARRGLAIAERRHRADDPEVAGALAVVAHLESLSGRWVEAGEHAERAIALWGASDPASPDVVIALGTLAQIETLRGRLDRAELAAARALEISETANDTPISSAQLNNLALVRWALGKTADAITLFGRALAFDEGMFGTDHPTIALTLYNLAALYRSSGDPEQAEKLAGRALELIERTLGPDHPSAAPGLRELAGIADARGAAGDALALYRRLLDVDERRLALQLAWGSEPMKLAVTALLRGDVDLAVSFHARSLPEDEHALAFAATAVLRHKGRVLDAGIAELGALRAHLTPEARSLVDRLTTRRAELAARTFATFDAARADADREAMHALRGEIDELEVSLSEVSGQCRGAVEPVTIAAAQAALPPRGALIEYVCYRAHDPARPFDQRWLEARYAAYWFTSRHHGWLDLGPAVRIHELVALAHRDLIARGGRDSLRELDAVLLAPVRDVLGDVDHLVISPDDALHLLPFEALVDDRGRYLVESLTFTYATGGRALLDPTQPLPPRAAPVIVAAPDYGPGARFASLGGAADEGADLIARYPSAKPLFGKCATKAALLEHAQGPYLLHVATHGFFARAEPFPQSEELVRHAKLAGVLPPATLQFGDPLDIAGLALAGANVDAAAILTAREVAGLDLWGTQLVVLSACETGLGNLAAGEGVMGLRRAIAMAGAAAHVVSLWSVDDAATRALMNQFYAELRREHAGRAEALARAKRTLLASAEYAHPWFWAAFVGAGDWRPMPSSQYQAHSSGGSGS